MSAHLQVSRIASLFCPADDEILTLAQGRIAVEQRADLLAHLGVCAACRLVVGETSKALATTSRPRGELGTFAAGAVLGERYQIHRRIGAGGMGEVYEATDLLLKERVACKTIICSALDDDRATQRIKSEVQIARRVSHPNVCRILEFGITDNVPFFTMELLAGQTLSARLAARGPVPIDEAQTLVHQILDGLSAIHARNIVHRDFKSDNIFLVEEKHGARVVITDFGLACAVELSRSLASSGRNVIGTLDYMSPEQLLGSKATSVFDLYALGVVLFELLTGQRPFVRGNPIAGAFRRFTNDAPLLSSVLPQIDRRWERVIARCLARDPADRYSTVDELRDDLFSPIEEPRASVRRRPIHWGLAVTGLGLIGALSLPRVLPAPLPRPTGDPRSDLAQSPVASAARSVTAPSVLPRFVVHASPSARSTHPTGHEAHARAAGHSRSHANLIERDPAPASGQTRSLRDAIYAPRFDVTPPHPTALDINGLPSPYPSHR